MMHASTAALAPVAGAARLPAHVTPTPRTFAMTAAQTFYLVIAALIVVLVGVEVLDYLADAPLREQVERCVENGGGNFCDGLVTE